MAPIFPRELPHHKLVECAFNLVEPVSLSRTQGRRVISAVDYADSYLSAQIETLPMTKQDRAVWEAWRASLRGGLKSFITHDTSRKELIGYPNGVPEIAAGTWDGKGTATAVAAHLITASGAPSGFRMSAGDLIGLQAGNPLRRWIGFVSETAVAGPSTIVVPVSNPVPTTIFTTGATVVFYRPEAEFILLSETWSCSKRNYLAPVSFEAVQKL